MDKQQVAVGYKLTEVGVIPEDWEVKRIGDTLTIRHGRDQKSVALPDGKYPILATGGVIGRTDTFLYDKPSVLIGRKGTINKPRYIDSPFWTVDTLFYSEVVKSYEPKFVYYKFCLIDWMQYNEASGVPSLNASTIENVIQSFPSCRIEQTAIANALSDVDALIAALEKLIHKKTAIKTAAMQQLLTGKKRLPPFDQLNTGYKQTELGEIPKDWEVKSLGDLVSISSGESPSKFNFIGVGIPYFKVEQLNNGIKYADVTEYYFESGNTVREGSIIFPKRGASILLNKIRILREASFMDTNLMTLTTNTDLYNEFLFYFLNFKGLDNIADTTSIPQINNKHIKPFLIPFPMLNEQTAIANVLSNMDTELNALQQRLAKTQQLKQGMMQELLTGKTRLVAA